MYFSLYFNFLTRILFSMADFTYLWLNLDFSSQIFQLCKFFSLNDQTFSYPGPTPCFCKVQDFWKIFLSNLLSYIRNYYSYRNVLYLILILLKNWFEHILCMFPVKLIFHDLWAKAQVYIFIPQTFLQNQEFLKNIFFKLLVIFQKLRTEHCVMTHFVPLPLAHISCITMMPVQKILLQSHDNVKSHLCCA